MKKIFILIILSFFALSVTGYAQLTPYFPAEHIETAKTEVEKNLTNPQLLSIVTVNGTLPGLEFGGTPIPIIFDMSDGDNKGKSSGWVYIFNSADEPDSIEAVVVGISLLGITPLNFKDLGVPLGLLADYVSDNTLDDETWINSPEMVDYLLASTQYQDFMNTYPEGVPQYISLGYADYESLDASTPYWFVTMHDVSDSTLIVINALTGEITGVEENQILDSEIQIYPNPAQNYALLKLPAGFFKMDADIEIFDLEGRMLLHQSKVNDSETIKIDLSDFSNGKYYIRYNINGIVKTLSVVVNR
ncbi:T9SS type A sorting domain-containing protein [Bacteroidota bacterium]